MTHSEYHTKEVFSILSTRYNKIVESPRRRTISRLLLCNTLLSDFTPLNGNGWGWGERRVTVWNTGDMFGLSKLFGSCGRLLWSDTETPGTGYDMVSKDDSAILNEFSPEEEPLSPEDIVVSQPIWQGRTDNAVKNKSVPDLKSLSSSMGSVYQSTTLSGIRSSKSTENVPSVSGSSQISRLSGSPKTSVIHSNPKKGHSVHISHAPSVFSSPIVKSTGNLNLPKPSGSRNSYKLSKKQKSEEVKLQIVSVV
ncbi:uncharacterized protein LOC125669664 [Ostrea edulis]|uniref:uncharacterized protein LOC125669664 n=1 Tax=Ostrea edulis TaxID=37623 RepID=UPI002095D762|nr:uncharacterized protein LOC125669664 [Ostrea edulis]